MGDDPEGEVDGDAAAAEVPRALLPRVGLQEVPEAAPHAHPSISLSLPPASSSAVAEVEFPGCGEARPAAGARAGLAGRLLLGCLCRCGGFSLRVSPVDEWARPADSGSRLFVFDSRRAEPRTPPYPLAPPPWVGRSTASR